MTRDFLVIYEEDDDGSANDAGFVVDVTTPRSRPVAGLEVTEAIQVDLSNTRSVLGTAGMITCAVGAILGGVSVAMFISQYPSAWDSAGGVFSSLNTVRTMTGSGLLGLIAMVAGTVMTHYGRRIRAVGHLKTVHIVEKAPSSQAVSK